MNNRQRKRSQSVKDRDGEMLISIHAIKHIHPLYGYRRVWAFAQRSRKILCC